MELVPIISKYPSLTDLRLSKNDVNKDMARNLGFSFNTFPVLQCLDLSNCQLGHDRLEALFTGLVEAKNLLSLDLS
jgi:hypothetical protein